jgi:integrase
MRRPYYKKSHKAWYCTIGGNQVRLGTDKESAEKEYHRLMAAETLITSKTTLAQLIDQFLHWTNENKAPRTFKWYQRHLKSFVQFIGYKLPVNHIKPAHLHRWLERSYKASGQSDRNGACRAMARTFNWAKKAGLIAANPIEGMERPGPVSRDCYITPEQWSEVIALVKADDPFADLLWFLHETGARPQEARTVSAKTFDKKRQCFVLQLKDSKGKKHRRVIRLNRKAFETCKRLAMKYPDGPLFRNSFGNPWTAYSLNNRFARLREKLQKAKVKARTWEREKEWVAMLFPYVLRHTFITDALLRGVDPLTVSLLAGHKDTTMVMRVYSHLSQNDEFLAAKLKQATGEQSDVA